MSNIKPCGNCGRPLDEAEQKGMTEFQGNMYSEVLTENTKIIMSQALLDMKDSWITHYQTTNADEPTSVPLDFIEKVAEEVLNT